MPHSGNLHGVVTVSCGVAASRTCAVHDTAALIALADAALYAAKEAGRNRINVADRITRGLRVIVAG